MGGALAVGGASATQLVPVVAAGATAQLGTVERAVPNSLENLEQAKKAAFLQALAAIGGVVHKGASIGLRTTWLTFIP